MDSPAMAMEATALPPTGTSATGAPVPRKIVVLDLVERAIVSAVFCRFAYLMLQNVSDTANIGAALMFVSELLAFVLIIIRPLSATLSIRPADWLFGVAGTIAPLLVRPAPVAPLLPETVCFAIIIAGIYLQIAAKVALGRSFGIIAANRGVKIGGPYRFVRHPMYAGYTVTHIGFLLTMPSLQNALFYAMALTFQVVRILREERVLNEAAEYREMAARVRYRLLPGVF